jgi:hypothetical protein
MGLASIYGNTVSDTVRRHMAAAADAVKLDFLRVPCLLRVGVSLLDNRVGMN